MAKKAKLPIGFNEAVLRKDVEVLWSKACDKGKAVGELFVTDQRLILSKRIPRFFRKDLIEYYSVPLVSSGNVAVIRYPKKSFFSESSRGEIQVISKGEFVDIEFTDSEDFVAITNTVYCLITGSSSGIVPSLKAFGDKVLDAVKEAAGFFFGDVGAQGAVGSEAAEVNDGSRAEAVAGMSGASQGGAEGLGSAMRQSDDGAGGLTSPNEVKSGSGVPERTDGKAGDRTRAAQSSCEEKRGRARTPDKVVAQCQTCGARFAGSRGRMKQCDYCGNPIRF